MPTTMSVESARDLLGLRHGHTADELRSAFRRLAKQLHPDNGGPGGEQFSRVVEAHDLLRVRSTSGDDALHDAHEPHGDAHVVHREVDKSRSPWIVHVPGEFVRYSDVVVNCGNGWTIRVPFLTPLPWNTRVEGPNGHVVDVEVRDGRHGLVVPGTVVHRRTHA